VLCRTCRRQVPRGAAYCSTCGARVKRRGTADDPLELVLRDGTRIPVAETVTIGRAPDNTIRLDDPSVSRHHATVVVNGGSPPQLVDTGSTAGTFLNGRKLETSGALADGAKIQLGNVILRVERRRDEAEAGRTLVVRPGSTILLPTIGQAELENATTYGFKPKLRSGYALKRLEASEGDKRFILRDLRGGGFTRMGADEAALFGLLDGEHSLVELMTEAEKRIGPRGAGTVASLLADLGEKGFLAGVERSGDGAMVGEGKLRRLLKPRDFTVRWLGPLFERLYRRGGFVLFTRPAFALMTVLAVGGMAVWIYLVAGRYGTPFVVAKKVGLGGLVFMLGRFVVVAFHEVAHGLTVSSFGRRVPRAGLKLMMVFPYAFVDTSEAWFEPQRRRLAISGAGPVSDFVVAGLFSFAALPSGDGTLRDIFFNLAFAAYVGGFFNLNPFLERDGYHMLVDLMREPGLRRRSRQWLVGILAGRGGGSEAHTRAFKFYGVSSVLWLFSGLLFAIIGTRRFYPVLVKIAPREVVWAGIGLVYLLALLPVVLVIGRPLMQRRKAAAQSEPAEA
jgi:putative peptide zinc metalloprotease protein